MLARLFGEQPHGTYVDIGAGDPVEGSVTKYFYEAGWDGINVEPIPELVEKLRRDRPRDATLAVAVGERPDRATLHVVAPEWGWSTVDGQLARGYREDRHWAVNEIEVEVVNLAAMLDEHPGDVDFLKIDVEGAELDVIAGGDWSRHRPRVLVVEATEPGTSIRSHQEWEPILVEAGYRCALFDGLNRFYADAGDEEALTRLAAPASVLDAYERYTRKLERDNQIGTVAYVRRLEEELRQQREARAADDSYMRELEAELGIVRLRAVRAESRSAALENRIAELENRAIELGS